MSDRQPESAVATLPPGTAGKVGELRLEFGERAGKTRLLTVRCRVPFHVGRVLYPERDWPELGHVLVTMPTGGFVQGDTATMAVIVRDGARVHLTSQSATRAYRCEAAPIRQQLSLEARGDSLLEWWPDPLIPFAGSDVDQTLAVTVDERATVLLADCWLAGRVARGEIHQYARLALTTQAQRPDGAVLFRDALRLEPGKQPPLSLGILGDALAVGSFFLIGPGVAERLGPGLAATLTSLLPGRAAASRLPGDVGLVVRVLARRSDELRLAQRKILVLARRALFGRAAGHEYKP
ncbi:MAG: urease accessory protein UreD [Chloroflexi bacterium]|nr:urease accessory protein UreD [Chloroflexota bacterium]